MNSHQRRKFIRSLHHNWPLGTSVLIGPGHHTPIVVGGPLRATILKHGFPCKRDECIVAFNMNVADRTFGAPRRSHYVKFKNLHKVK